MRGGWTDRRMRRVAERKQKTRRVAREGEDGGVGEVGGGGGGGVGEVGGDGGAGEWWWGRRGVRLSAKHIKTPLLDGRLWETRCGVKCLNLAKRERI